MALVLDASALTTLDALKDELGITGAAEDENLKRLIKRASAVVVSFLHRKLHYEAAIVEPFAGYGTLEIALERPPVWSIAQITLDGSIIAASDYEIKDAEAGTVLHLGSGWTWFTAINPGIVQDPRPGSERRLYEATYAGGFWTPQQEELTPGVPAGVEELPADIELGVLNYLTHLYERQGVDPNVASEGLLSHSVSYRAEPGTTDEDNDNGPLPPSVAATLRPHRFAAQST